jgi:hypothetical protein
MMELLGKKTSAKLEQSLRAKFKQIMYKKRTSSSTASNDRITMTSSSSSLADSATTTGSLQSTLEEGTYDFNNILACLISTTTKKSVRFAHVIVSEAIAAPQQYQYISEEDKMSLYYTPAELWAFRVEAFDFDVSLYYTSAELWAYRVEAFDCHCDEQESMIASHNNMGKEQHYTFFDSSSVVVSTAAMGGQTSFDFIRCLAAFVLTVALIEICAKS